MGLRCSIKSQWLTADRYSASYPVCGPSSVRSVPLFELTPGKAPDSQSQTAVPRRFRSNGPQPESRVLSPLRPAHAVVLISVAALSVQPIIPQGILCVLVATSSIPLPGSSFGCFSLSKDLDQRFMTSSQKARRIGRPSGQSGDHAAVPTILSPVPCAALSRRSTWAAKPETPRRWALCTWPSAHRRRR